LTLLTNERNAFPAKNQILKILQKTCFAYKVGIISSYSNRILPLLRWSAFHQVSCW